MKTIKIITLLIIVSVLVGCGYKIAGEADLDSVFDKTHVTYQARGKAMAELVEQQLRVNQNELVSAEDASAIVTILYERTEREILALDEEGKVREYELILRVGFSVKDAEGKAMIKNQNIRLSRAYLFDLDNVLGGRLEEKLLYQEMREDASRLIVYRLQAVTSEQVEES